MIRCLKCGREHDVTDKTYFTIHGNIYIGDLGGIVGNNFPRLELHEASEQLPYSEVADAVKRTYFCIGCFYELIGEHRTELIKLHKAKVRDYDCKMGVQLNTLEDDR